jgi:hypothetical protein
LIISFRCAETEKIYREKSSRRFGNIQRVAFRRLVLLDSAAALADLAGSGASLEALKGFVKVSTRSGLTINTVSVSHGRTERPAMSRLSIIIKEESNAEQKAKRSGASR